MLNTLGSFNQKKSINILFVLVIFDLVLGGSGRLITFGEFLTLRYVLFGFSLIYFVLNTLIKNLKINKNIFYLPVIIFFCFWVLSIFIGLSRGYEIRKIMSSSQGFLYLLLIFPFTIFLNEISKIRTAIILFNRFVFWLSLLALSLFFLVNVYPTLFPKVNSVLQYLEYGHLSIRLGRANVFLKTSVFIPISLVFNLNYFINENNKKLKTVFKIIILFLASLTNVNMTIWIPLFIGVIITLFLTLSKKNLKYITFALFIFLLLVIVFQDLIMFVFTNRISLQDSSYIIKYEQLVALLNAWTNNLFFGKGFGATIIFNTSLGIYRNTVFELMWFGILMNMGFFGFVSYCYLFLKTFFEGFKLYLQKHFTLKDKIIIKSLLIGLIMIMISSSVNPFLNNPIGIGYFILTMSIVNFYYKKFYYLKLKEGEDGF